MIQLNPTLPNEINEQVDNYVSILFGKEAIYISGPITTGKDFLKWYNNRGRFFNDQSEYKKAHQEEIIKINSDLISDFSSYFKTIEKSIIIEPASLVKSGWSQPDYLYYWGQIITKCVKKIVFLDGWYFSNGCIYEYYIGLIKGIELVDQNFQPLLLETVILKIEESIQEYELSGINVDFQKTVLSEIKNENKNE